MGRRLTVGLYHFDKREYDPKLGRWITPDPAGLIDGPNLYAYVKNNPWNYVDPYGLFAFDLMGIAGGTGRAILDNASFGISSFILGEYKGSSPEAQNAYDVSDQTITYGSILLPQKAVANVGIGAVKWGARKAMPLIRGSKVMERFSEVGRISNIARENIGKTASALNRTSRQAMHPEKLTYSLDKLSEAGKMMDRGGLSRAGRALDKHGGRPNSAFPKAAGNQTQKNAQGQYHLDDILTDPRGYSKPNNFEGMDYFRFDHSGVRFYNDGSFRGFLEPNL